MVVVVHVQFYVMRQAPLNDHLQTVEWPLPRSCKNKLFGRPVQQCNCKAKSPLQYTCSPNTFWRRTNKNTFIAIRPSFKGCWPTPTENAERKCSDVLRRAELQTCGDQTQKHVVKMCMNRNAGQTNFNIDIILPLPINMVDNINVTKEKYLHTDCNENKMWKEADKKSAGSSSQISKRFRLKRFSLNLRPSKNSASKYLVSTKFSLRKVSLRSHDRRRLNSADSCSNPNHPSHHGIYSVLMVVCSCTSSVTHCTWVYCHVFIFHCWLFLWRNNNKIYSYSVRAVVRAHLRWPTALGESFNPFLLFQIPLQHFYWTGWSLSSLQ